MIEFGFIKAQGINYAGTIPKIKKSKNKLQPLFEAITNSLESLQLVEDQNFQKRIKIQILLNKNLLSSEKEKFDFQEFLIEDNGIGFTDSEFDRIVNLNDNRKGFLNKGTGRVQFLHFFEKSQYSSLYRKNGSINELWERKLELSKKKAFLDKNSIIKYISNEKTDELNRSTVLRLQNTLNESDQSFYSELTPEDLKNAIIDHYLSYFCENRNNFPEFTIQRLINDHLKDETKIVGSDIPEVDYETPFHVNYSEINGDGKKIIPTDEVEKFHLKSFVIDKDKLEKNSLSLVSKGQIAKKLKIENLSSSDHISGKRYLFLLSGKYIDERDSDNRGDLKIPTQEEFKDKSHELFSDKEILIENLQSNANEIINDYYSEIKKKKEDKQRNLRKLMDMFLLDRETVEKLNITINDSDAEILKKVYQSDAQSVAKRDAEIKQKIEDLDKLGTKSENYTEELEKSVNELVRTIPLQNRTSLTHYVARRKLVLELFEKIMEKQLESLKTRGFIDEDLLHNLIFQQSSENSQDSDLWIFNEEFIYFKGVSEKKLSQLELKGKKVFKEKFEEEEERFLNSLGEKRLDRRPDILLFPAEGKCIIIEFKSPDVNASKHLTQIDQYASLIRNYTTDDFEILTFYGYLVGENIEPRDVIGAVSQYEESYHFDYLFRPGTKVTGFDGRRNGSIYSEVIKFSTLLKRAKLRNKVFIDKLSEIGPE
tara:strand:+ start:250 stop:2379 length:2130 start_codon:yes stop_codon:yes gene_type:complete